MMNSNTLDTDSTSRAKKFLPFWDKSCQEISRQLWSSIALTYSRPGVDRSILSSGSVNSKIANSWFCAEQTYLPNQKWLKISYESSRLTIADSTPSVKTNLLSKKIRVYPETKLAQKWRTWIAASRWCYNQAIAILKNEKIGKYELRKRIMDSAPEWVSQQPYNPRQLAVFQACEAHKAACKSQGTAKFRSCKAPTQTIRFQTANWKSNTFYPRETKGLSFKASEAIVEVMQHEPTLSIINDQWFICYAVDTVAPPPTQSELAIALDPGIRTFMTGFDGHNILKLGKSDIGRIYRLARHLDKLMSRLGKSKGSQFKRLRYRSRKVAARIRVKIKNLVSELHNKAANYLVSKYKLIFLPTFETQQMVKKGKRKLATKTARAMVTLSHYRFKQTLKHQASKYGCVVVDVTEEYTSKTCSKCGHIHSKLGGLKTFKCPECGHTLDRDLNGAFNILLKALRDTSMSGKLQAFQIMPYTVDLGGFLDLPG
ncbi:MULTISPECIES: transposase [unclassified Microcoleus]|uniref:RNA-guided endonuclease InsQ/TnpB family protein n=1 Tax=unclassified Microcoleus TaxID=2642155 RepID=UPI0025FE6277|nr:MULTISPECIES: transposase [unclassified Microcoleus]